MTKASNEILLRFEAVTIFCGILANDLVDAGVIKKCKLDRAVDTLKKQNPDLAACFADLFCGGSKSAEILTFPPDTE